MLHLIFRLSNCDFRALAFLLPCRSSLFLDFLPGRRSSVAADDPASLSARFRLRSPLLVAFPEIQNHSAVIATKIKQKQKLFLYILMVVKTTINNNETVLFVLILVVNCNHVFSYCMFKTALCK